SPLLP
ncbi:phosphomannomutase, partial [Escherichia coli ARS4.2123]